jgi:hypothetical protein
MLKWTIITTPFSFSLLELNNMLLTTPNHTLRQNDLEEIKERIALLAFNFCDAKQQEAGFDHSAAWLFQIRQHQASWNKNYREPDLPLEAIEDARYFLDSAAVLGLLTPTATENGNPSYAFTQPAFQTYYCAYYCAHQPLNPAWVWRTNDLDAEIWHCWHKLDKTLVPTLLGWLSGRDTVAITGAITALGLIGDESAIEPLLKKVESQDSTVRFYAAQALARIGTPRVVEPLILAMGDTREEVSWQISQMLAKMGDEVIQPLIEALPNQIVRGWVMDALKAIGEKAVLPLIHAALHHSQREVRYLAIQTLSRTKDKRALEPLTQLAQDTDQQVRTAAASALKMMGANTSSSLGTSNSARLRRAVTG